MAQHPSISDVKKIIFLLPVWQLVIGVLVAVVFYMLIGSTAAMAGFFGASISFAGSLVFAFMIFSFGDQDPKNMMQKMFRAEALKIAVIAIMFYCAFAILALPFMPVMVGFMVTLIVFFVALLTVFR